MNEALFNFLSWINSWTGSWGWAMVVFTVLIRLAMTPLDYKSRVGMRKTTLIQPKIAELQRKYANDKEKLNQKTAELYKKEGVNPMSSCLPLLLTWPVLIIVFAAMRTAANREILEQLEADGILHDNQELELPSLLKRIAIVSSAGAAGYGDFCNQLENNDYGLAFHLQLFPAVMQGEHVEESVLAALAAIADEADRWDCAVIIRGGGATSDLSDFDSYHLAAAITQMPLPVIVGIGHERDETVLDFVAHTRVKTPTAAAAFLINHGAEQLARLNTLQDRIMQMPRLQLQAARERMTRLQTLLPRTVAMTIERERHKQQQLSQRFRHTPLLRVQSSRLTAQSLEVRIANAAKLALQGSRLKVQSLETRLAALDPALQLRRGFSLTYSSDGHLLRSIADIRPGDTITTRLADGDVAAVTTSVQNTQHNR